MRSEPGEALPPAAGGRRLHPLTLLFAGAGVARQMIVPAVVGGVSFGDGRLDRVIPWVLVLLAVPALLAAAARYASFRWTLAEDEVALRSGVLNRRHRVIPLARIQNVEVRQSVVERLFAVAEVRVETAGAGEEAEAVLSVLGAGEAQRLRTALLAGRGGSVDADGGAEEARAQEPPLAALSVRDLLVAGATANEAGVIAAALAGALQFADDLPWVRLEHLIPRGVVDGRGVLELVVLGVGFVVGVVLLGWLISVAGALIRYYGFTLRREGEQLRKRYGLLTVHETSVPLERVQAIRVEESFLRRPLGLASLMIETAGGTPGEAGGAEAFVPVARRGEVARLVRGIFHDLELDAVPLHRVHPLSQTRAMRRYYLGFLLVAAALAVLARVAHEPALLAVLVPLLPLPWLLARWGFANRGYGLAPGYFVARDGVLNRVTWIVPDEKLQTVRVADTPFQRRLGLASLAVDTAAGGKPATVVDLAAPTARSVLDELMARVRGT